LKAAERTTLEYRPVLGHRPAVSYLAKSLSEDPKATELVDCMSIKATDLLGTCLDTKTAAEKIVSGLEACLNDVAGPVSLKDYLLARESGNREVTDQFEDYHRNDIGGSLQAEVYPVLLDLLGDIDECASHAQNAFFGGPVDTSKLEQLGEEEGKRYDKLAGQAAAGGELDKLSLSYEAKLKYQLKDKIEGIQGFLTQIVNVMTTAPKDTLKDVRNVVTDLARAPGELGNIKTLNSVNWRREATLGQKTHNRAKNFDSSGMAKMLNVSVLRLKETRLEKVRPLVNWIKGLDPKSPTNILAGQIVSGMEDVDEAVDSTVLDMAKLNKSDAQTREDLVTSLKKKKTVRQIHQIVDGMQKYFNFENADLNKEVERFIANTGLDKDGDLCS